MNHDNYWIERQRRVKLEEYNRGMLAQYGAGCLTPEEEKRTE